MKGSRAAADRSIIDDGERRALTDGPSQTGPHGRVPADGPRTDPHRRLAPALEQTVTDQLPDGGGTSAPPSRAWRYAALAVPVLVVLAGVLGAVFLRLSDDHLHHESHACRWIPLPWTIWATSYGGLVAALLAIALYTVLGRHARACGRGGQEKETWQGRLAGAFAVLAGLAAVALVLAVFLVHLDSHDIATHRDQPMCEGLRA